MEVVNLDDISTLGAQTMVTVGMFDGVHLGHRHLLQVLADQSASEGFAPVVVTFDRHPRLVLNPADDIALLSTLGERLALLEAFGVQQVVIVHFTPHTAALSACDFVRQILVPRLGMRRLLLGYDNSFGSRQNNDFDLLPQLAGELGFAIVRDGAVRVGGIEVSSTKIRKALKEGNIEHANALLGAPYRLTGTVVHGRHVGTAIGFPTANIVPADRHKLLPAAGVYALRASVSRQSCLAMANLGAQPTFHQSHPVTEVHLIGFEGDIYGKEVSVQFLARLREVRAFDSPDALVTQLEKDRSFILNTFSL